MATSDESFLPQIIGLFYATFDPRLGPTVLHQVPDNLITPTSQPSASHSRSRSRSRSHASSSSRSPRRPRPPSPPSGPTLLDFAPISDYVIPKKALHNKLVTLLTSSQQDDNDDGAATYRLMGFPSVLAGEGGRYDRNEYMWNLVFVFHAAASLEAFEPVVRKCARILKAAEIDTGFLSSPKSEHTPLPAVLEQLFEDLNSYSETSIPLDGFNSLELKLFPFFPNPPECQDWQVPIPLVSLNTLKDDNWDITAARVATHIDGVNHVHRIAELADADPALTRETLRHMLFYQVVMMVDIFQYSNMYTFKPSISRLASDETIIYECSSYVTQAHHDRPSWPTLLSLYAKLLPGVTVHEWVEANDVLSLGIDPRRFVSFGIIKGFLRRVHRWPVLLDKPSDSSMIIDPSKSKPRVGFDKSARKSGESLPRSGAGQGDSTFTLRSMSSNPSLGVSPSSLPTRTPPSIAGKSPRRPLAFAQSRSIDTHPSSSSRRAHSTLKAGALRIREEQSRQLEEELVGYLMDGTHHTDEIQVRFGMGWAQLERVLGVEEGGKARKGVVIVYR